jgi:hypothetical protein
LDGLLDDAETVLAQAKLHLKANGGKPQVGVLGAVSELVVVPIQQKDAQYPDCDKVMPKLDAHETSKPIGFDGKFLGDVARAADRIHRAVHGKKGPGRLEMRVNGEDGPMRVDAGDDSLAFTAVLMPVRL